MKSSEDEVTYIFTVPKTEHNQQQNINIIKNNGVEEEH